ncbi:hypothetical protein N8843_01055 [Verrucomicrobia bacterium]|nr:hypothetical protein [Verrucomicrobiota bacterium]
MTYLDFTLACRGLCSFGDGQSVFYQVQWVSNANLTATESARGIKPDFDALYLEYHGPNKQKSDL